MDNSEQLYFCGLMVFTKTEAPAFNVLDGQQRLATTAYDTWGHSQLAWELLCL